MLFLFYVQWDISLYRKVSYLKSTHMWIAYNHNLIQNKQNAPFLTKSELQGYLDFQYQ